MASRPDVERLRSANAGLVRIVTADLNGFWGSLNLSRPEAARDALLDFLPALVTKYGDAAATVAADWYSDVRNAAGVRGPFVPLLAEAVDSDRVASTVRFAAQHLFTDDPSQTLASLSGAVSKYALEPGRQTIVESAIRDPRASGWKRVTRGGGCDFCRMLEGRGGVYKEATAHFASHGHCHCAAVPSWDEHAPEVDVRAYVASQRLDTLRRQAAGEDVTLSSRQLKSLDRRGLTAQEDAQRQLTEHRARVRGYVADFNGDH